MYAPQIEGAGNTLTGAYNTNAPKIQGYADQIGGLIPDMLAKYQAGNPAVGAAQDYITTTLGSDPAQNPYLEALIDQTNNDVANTTNAKLGVRGLTGGTVQNDILSRNLAENETGLRYTDFNNQQQRQAQAAGLAPGVAAADTIQIAPLLAAAQTASGLPLDAATQYAAGTGGLLGQYTNQTQKKSGGLLGSLIGAGLSGWASGGFA